MADSTDVALAEYDALRAEILNVEQFEQRGFAGALTIVAAVGSFALAKKDGRLELLMVLPVVLSGLGLLQAHCVQQISQLGDYIREHLWTRLPVDPSAECLSWEHLIEAGRRRSRPGYLVGGLLARVLIFGLPSVASIVITGHQWNTNLAALWWGDVLVVVVSGILALRVLIEVGASAARNAMPS
jgi:hypothetical protein